MGLLDPHHLIATFGAIGIFVIVFAETGLLIGFFLPGDSLLFTAGLLAATSRATPAHVPLAPALLAAGAGAVLGAQTGYLLGRRVGPRLLRDSGHRRRQEGLTRARRVLHGYGDAKAVVLARFIPVVRTLMNPLAGALGVRSSVFTTWQLIGGLVWSTGVTLAGYWLGRRIPGIDKYLLPIVALVVVVSLLPIAIEILRTRRQAPSQ